MMRQQSENQETGRPEIRRPKTARRAGFTLVETLAALAITMAIIVSTGALLHQSVFFFDHGTRTVDESERLALAIDSLSRDFGATRFVSARDPKKTAFTGLPGSPERNAKISFITSGGKAAGPQGEEVVSLTIEPSDGETQLVRRRAVWHGPRMGLEDAQPGDPVILLKGQFGMSFSYSELNEQGAVIWHDSWTGETGLPHSVRLNLRDEETGASLLPGAEFPIYANAPAACSLGKADCLRSAKDKDKDKAAPPKSGSPAPSPAGDSNG